MGRGTRYPSPMQTLDLDLSDPLVVELFMQAHHVVSADRLRAAQCENIRLRKMIEDEPRIVPLNAPPSYSYLGEWLPRRISIPESWRQPLLELAGAVLVIAVPLIMAFLGR